MKKTSKDYYEILGVSPMASEDEIKKAYRQLARKHHPDVAVNRVAAEEAFKEINEAHETLINIARRRSYDAQRGTRWQEADFRAHARPTEPTPETDPFRDGHWQDFGFRFDRTERRHGFDSSFRSTANHGRAGFEPSQENSRHQQGMHNADIEVDIVVTLEEVMQGSVRPFSFHYGAVCEDCEGLGRQGFRPCVTCDSNGRSVKTHNYRVRIPVGVHDGQRLKLASKGEWGGAQDLGGDVYLRVRLATHPLFRMQDGALYYDLILQQSELDGEATSFVPTLNGRFLIKIPPGLRNGQTLRVRNQGLPQADGQRGDLFIVIRIQGSENVTGNRRRASGDTAFYARR